MTYDNGDVFEVTFEKGKEVRQIQTAWAKPESLPSQPDQDHDDDISELGEGTIGGGGAPDDQEASNDGGGDDDDLVRAIANSLADMEQKEAVPQPAPPSGMDLLHEWALESFGSSSSSSSSGGGGKQEGFAFHKDLGNMPPAPPAP